LICENIQLQPPKMAVIILLYQTNIKNPEEENYPAGIIFAVQ